MGENIDDILDKLGITEEDTYTIKDVDRVYKQMLFVKRGHSDIEDDGSFNFEHFDPKMILQNILPETIQLELTKKEMKNLLEKIHKEINVLDEELLENIDDILDKLGITEEDTYTIKDVDRVYKQMLFVKRGHSDIEDDGSFNFEHFDPKMILQNILPETIQLE